jgi:putative solute:sodium symporter small subunit
MEERPVDPERWRRARRLSFALLALWFVVGFGLVYFARGLNRVDFFGWPLGFWIAAQGALLVFLAIVVGYAWVMGKNSSKT